MYYRGNNFTEAIIYFDKALKNIPPNRKYLIYIASMHNNMALSYEKMGKLDLALKEIQRAIQILETSEKLDENEYGFLINLKANSGLCYYKLKKYDIAESLLFEEYYFNKSKNDFSTAAAENITELFNVYYDTGQMSKMQELMDDAISREVEMKNIPDKILMHQMFQSYYLKTHDDEKLEKVNKKLIALHIKNNEVEQKKGTSD